MSSTSDASDPMIRHDKSKEIRMQSEWSMMNQHRVTCGDVRLGAKLHHLESILTDILLSSQQAQAQNQSIQSLQCDNSNTIFKIKFIFKLYKTLLLAGPLDFRVRPETKSKRAIVQHRASSVDLIQSSQQVLKYIESLPGYCDLINSLRLILKSASMINVMFAYNSVIALIKASEDTFD